MHAKVLGVDPDGVLLSFIRKGDEYSTIRPFPAEYLDERLTEYNGVRIGGEAAAEEAQTEEPQPIGRGAFGEIYDQFRGKAKAAIDFLMRKKSGEAVGALHHKDIGDIDLVWGDGKYGLSHIIEKHPNVTEDLQGMIDDMQIVQSSDNRIVLENPTHKAIVSKMLGQEKTPQWLLTAYEKKNATGGSSDIGPEPIVGKQNGTAPLQNTSSEGEDTANAAIEQESRDNSAMSRIPVDEKTGEPLFELAETPELAWDAIVEQTEGDEAMAQTVADGMVADKRSALDKAEKAKSKGGNTVTEKIAAEKERKAAIEKARNELAIWELIAGTAARRAQEAEEMAAAESAVEEEVPATNDAGEVKLTREEATAKLSTTEKDDFGRPFVTAKDGTTTFGVVDAESGLTEAPIKLSAGENYIGSDGKNHGYGLLHIEAGHGEQIRDAGYKSVEQFVEEVAKNYTDIREGALIGNNQTYLLEVSDEHNNTLFIQLSRDESYWNVNSAGIFKKKYSRRKQKVYSVPAVGESTDTDASEVNSDQSEGAIAPAGNSSKTSKDVPNDDRLSSEGKSNENLSEAQESVQEKVEDENSDSSTSLRMTNSEATEAVLEMLEDAGIEVVMDEKEMAAVLEANEQLQEMKKSALESTSALQREHHPAVTSSSDGAKVIEKIRNSKSAEITGEEVTPSEDLKQYKKNALEYGKTLRGEYTNADTGVTITLSSGNKNGGIKEVLQHDIWDVAHLKSIAAIPQIIENGIYIGGSLNEDAEKNPNVSRYHYYVCGLNIGGTDYTVRAVVAEQSNGERYYDHKLTQIEKGELLSLLNSNSPISSVASSELSSMGERGDNEQSHPATDNREINASPISVGKDKKLISLLKGLVSENSSPLQLMAVYHGSGAAFDAFDHSHMGEGEGAQAYGWGTYVTEVEGIARRYAKSSENNNLTDNELSSLENELIGEVVYEVCENFGITEDFIGVFYPADGFWFENYDKELLLEDAKNYFKERDKSFFSEEELDDEELADDIINEFEKEVGSEIYRLYNERYEERVTNPNFLYTVEIPEDNGSNYLEWDEPVNDDFAKRINETVIREYGEDIAELIMRPIEKGNVFSRVYSIIANDTRLGSDKAASELLSKAGFAGIKYPAQYQTGGREDNAKNYVIFNEADAKITERIQFLKTSKGEVYGFVKDGKIYLDPKLLNANTPIHEYTHIWDMALQKSNPELWARGVELMKQTPLWDEVKNNPAYADIAEDDNLIASEVHARLTGKEGADLLERLSEEAKKEIDFFRMAEKISLVESLRRWIRDAWKWIKDTMTPWTKEEAAAVSLEEFVNMPIADLARKAPSDSPIMGREAEGTPVQFRNDIVYLQTYTTKNGERISFTATGPNAVHIDAGNSEVQREGKSFTDSLRDGKFGDGEFCNVERRFTESGAFSFVAGEKIETYQDVAYIFKQLENKAIENAFVALVKDGKVTVLHLGMGTQSKSVYDTAAVIVADNKLNADKIYFVHNHPSGNIECSPQDKASLAHLRKIFGDKLQDGIIIDTTRGIFGTFNEGTKETSEHKRTEISGGTPIKTYTFDTQVFAPDYVPMANRVLSSHDVVKFICSHRLGGRPKIGVLVTDNSLSVLGNVFTEFTNISNENYKDVVKRVAGEALLMGGRSVVLYGDFKNKSEYSLVDEFEGYGIVLNDIINIQGNNSDYYKSGADDGGLFETETEYNSNSESASSEEDLMFRTFGGNSGYVGYSMSKRAAEAKREGRYPKGEFRREFGVSPKAFDFLVKYDFINDSEWHHTSKFGNKTTFYGWAEPYYADAYAENKAEIDKLCRSDKKKEEILSQIEDLLESSKVANEYREQKRMEEIREKNAKKESALRNKYNSEKKDALHLPYHASNGVVVSEDFHFSRNGNPMKDTNPKGLEAIEEYKGKFGDIRFPTFEEWKENNESTFTRSRVEELSSLLGVKIEVIENGRGLEGKKARAKGWFDKRTGKISVVLGNHTSVEDIEKTVLHEAVAHYGLRKLFGEHFDKFIDNVWYKSSKEVREQIASLMAKHGWDYRVATEEYLASLAEDANFENAVKTGWWEKLKQFFADMLRSLGIGYEGAELTDNELRYILWSSYENLKNGGKRNIFDEASDIVKQEELGLIDNGELTIDNESKEEDIDAVNAKFNEELAELTEDNADSVTFNLGRPSAILRAAGVEDMPMKLYGNKVIKKMKKHGFSLEELRNLPSAVANPIAVFNNYNKDANRSVLTELQVGDKHILVSITIGKNGVDADFNIISSVFGKGHDNIVDWINKGYATYLNKEKALDYLHFSERGISEASNNQELVSAANIVENFENPSVEGENDVLFREGSPEARERVMAAERYEQRVKSGMYQMQEALQDSMLGLKEAMTAIIGDDVRIEDIAGFENAYLGENRLSSVNKAEADAMAQMLFKPLFEEVAKLAPNEEAREELIDYMFAKHGIERNRVMAEREAEKAFAEQEKDKEKAGKNSYEDFLRKFRKYDYAGLTALFKNEFTPGVKPTTRELEAKARKLVEAYEGEHNTDALWERINAISKATLSKQYECGLLSKEAYEDISSMYEYYIPLRGFDEKTSEEAYAYLNHKQSAFNAPIKKARGRKSKADDPFAQMQSMAESAIVQGNIKKFNGMPLGIPLNFFMNMDYLSDSRRQTPSSPRTRSSLCSSLFPLPKVLVSFTFAVLPSSAIVHSSIVQLLSPPAAPKKASANPLS